VKTLLYLGSSTYGKKPYTNVENAMKVGAFLSKFEKKKREFKKLETKMKLYSLPGWLLFT